ncbi:MAG: hypothetical protein HKN91_12920 [Acidimicrobiia bacterium]|nr:hypothetical protein [Acidimicrobiia bacterium]
MRLRIPVPVRWAIGLALFVALFAWYTAPNPVQIADSDDPFVGRWLVNGTDAFGSEYSGSLTIQPEGEGYRLEWIITGALVSGVGTSDGEVLTATWESSASGRELSGSAEYRLLGEMLSGVIRPDGAVENGIEAAERLPG